MKTKSRATYTGIKRTQVHKLWQKKRHTLTHTETTQHLNVVISRALTCSLNNNPLAPENQHASTRLQWELLPAAVLHKDGEIQMTEPLNIWHFQTWWNKSETAGRVQGHCSGVFRVSLLFVLDTNECLPCPTPVVKVSKSVTSSWALHCVHFLPGHSETFTPGLFIMCEGACIYEFVCARVRATWYVLCTCPDNFPLRSYNGHISSHKVMKYMQWERIMTFPNLSLQLWLPALMGFIRNDGKKKSAQDRCWCFLNL